MKQFRTFSVVVALISPMCPSAGALADVVNWKTVAQGFEIAENQRWEVKNPVAGRDAGGFVFTAARFHLGYFELRLVELAELARSHRERIARDQDADPSTPALFELGLRTVFKTNPFDARLVAVAPAGFPTSSQDSSSLGLLKIDGKERSRVLEKGPNALFCLDNARSDKYEYQVPAFYRTEIPGQRRFLQNCDDAVQVGPRIIEDAASPDKRGYGVRTHKQKQGNTTVDVPVYLGIREEAAKSPPVMRAILAIDDPGRTGRRREERDLARNAYIVVTTTPTTLWDLQDMLISPDFYANEQYAPRWALNLPGDDYAALIYVTSPDSEAATEIGDVRVRQASALAVVQKK